MLSMTCTPSEMMVVQAARELSDGEVVFVGIGLPNLACNLARLTHAPNLVMIYESARGRRPERLPFPYGDPSLVTGSLMICGMADVFQLFLQGGRIEVASSAGRRSTASATSYDLVVTTRDHACDCRSGGAPEIAIPRPPDLVISRLDHRAFPEQVDFITSPVIVALGNRRELGCPAPGRYGDHRSRTLAANTDMVSWNSMRFYPGMSVDDCAATVGWSPSARDPLGRVDPPRPKNSTPPRRGGPKRRSLAP